MNIEIGDNEIVKTEFDEEKNEIETSLDHVSIISTLWKAVQELNEEIKTLKNK